MYLQIQRLLPFFAALQSASPGLYDIELYCPPDPWIFNSTVVIRMILEVDSFRDRCEGHKWADHEIAYMKRPAVRLCTIYIAPDMCEHDERTTATNCHCIGYNYTHIAFVLYLKIVENTPYSIYVSNDCAGTSITGRDSNHWYSLRRNCEDRAIQTRGYIDHCKPGTLKCPQLCIDNACRCKFGFTLNADNRTCTTTGWRPLPGHIPRKYRKLRPGIMVSVADILQCSMAILSGALIMILIIGNRHNCS